MTKNREEWTRSIHGKWLTLAREEKCHKTVQDRNRTVQNRETEREERERKRFTTAPILVLQLCDALCNINRLEQPVRNYQV